MSEQPIAYEEVPGSRTAQNTVVQPHRERIAYEELQPGDIIQEGDEWQNDFGRWQPFLVLDGSRVQVRQSQRVRRPHNITALQHERDELQTALRECRAAHQVTMTQGLAVCKERDEAQQAVARMKAELANQSEVLAEVRVDEERLCDDLSRLRGEYLKVLVERDEAREASQQLLQTITNNADQFADAGKTLEQQRDEACAEVQRLQEVVGNLYNEPTAKQVQDMLRTWITAVDWSAGCFDSNGREQIDTIQKTLIAVMERIDTLNPEGGTDDN